MKHSGLARWFSIFFFTSGFCSLVYQVVWLRLAMAAFGATTAVASIVISVFMAGLALGSWGGGLVAARVRSPRPRLPLRFYALAEGLVCSSAFIVPAALLWGRHVLSGWAMAQWGSLGYYAAVLAFVTLLLLPFCIAMGTTIPFALWVLRRAAPAAERRGFSRLYAANVVGAALGSLVAAFVLIEWLGFTHCLIVVAGVNSLLAVAALILSLRDQGPSASPDAAPQAAAEQAPERSPALSFALVLLFATGMASMAMEIAWSRQYTPHLGNLVYSFATILAVYLSATYAGTLIYRHRRWSQSEWPRPSLWSALALLGLLPIIMVDPRLAIPPGFVGGMLRVVVGIGPFSAVLGYLTPYLIDRFSGGDPGRAGQAYAINTIGCIIGPLLASFALLPILPERWMLVVLVGLLLLLAYALRLVGFREPTGIRLQISLAATLGVCLAVGFLGRSLEDLDPDALVVRDHTATVTAKGKGLNKRLLVNGTGMTILTTNTKMMAHVALAYHPPVAERALIICFGMGTSFRSALSWVSDVTAVELVPSVAGLFGFYHADGPALLRSPTARIVVDDGRRFLETTADTYDVIVIDPPPPLEAAGSSLLYSAEFYEVAAKRLRPAGILQQWVPGEPDSFTTLSFVHAFARSFKHVRFFMSVKGWGLHMLGSDRPFDDLDAGQLAMRLPARAAADLIEWSPGKTPRDLFATLLEHEVDEGQLTQRAGRVPYLRDDRPFNEYFVLRTLLPGLAPSDTTTRSLNSVILRRSNALPKH